MSITFHTIDESHCDDKNLPEHIQGINDLTIEHHPAHDLRDGWQRVIFDVGHGDCAVASGSSKRVVWGPCTMVYEIHQSGITAYEFECAADFYAKLIDNAEHRARRRQDENADEGNEDHISGALCCLSDAESHLEALTP